MLVAVIDDPQYFISSIRFSMLPKLNSVDGSHCPAPRALENF